MFSEIEYLTTKENALLDFYIDIKSFVDEINDLHDIISLRPNSLLYKEIGHFYRTKNWKKMI